MGAQQTLGRLPSTVAFHPSQTFKLRHCPAFEQLAEGGVGKDDGFVLWGVGPVFLQNLQAQAVGRSEGSLVQAFLVNVMQKGRLQPGNIRTKRLIRRIVAKGAIE